MIASQEEITTGFYPLLHSTHENMPNETALNRLECTKSNLEYYGEKPSIALNMPTIIFFLFLSSVLIKRGIGIIQSGIHTTAHNILSSSYISSTHVAAGFCLLNAFNTTLYVPPSTTGVSKVESTFTEISSIRGSGREEGLNNECVAIRRYESLCK